MAAPPVFGRYQVIEIIGAGPHGRVLKVEDLQSNEIRALKVLLDDSGKSSLFEDFATLSSVKHPNIIELYDSGHDATGLSYYSMEMLEGHDLGTLKDEAVPVGVGLAYLEAALTGLACLHLRGLVHGNLKPTNLFVKRGPKDAESIILMDPGLSCVPSGHGSSALAYLAPECLNGAPAGIRSDLYSLGAVFYEIFTGCFPFTSKSSEGLYRSKRSGVIAAPSSLRPDIPPGVDALILKMLSPDPAERPASAELVLELLSRAQAVLPEGERGDGALRLPLVGRNKILEAIDQSATLGPAEGPKLLFLTGGPGVGKSRLLQEAKLRLRRQEFQVASTRCFAHERQVESIGRLLKTLVKPAELDDADFRARYAALLRPYLPDISAFSRARRPLGTLDWRGRGTSYARAMADRLAQLIAELAEEPLAILIDDLHLASDALQRMLVQLTLGQTRAPLVVIATLDASELTELDPIQSLLDDRHIPRHEISGLSTSQVDQAIREALGVGGGIGAFIRELDHKAGNNPAKIQLVLRKAIEKGGFFPGSEGWGINEEALEDVIHHLRLERNRLSHIQMDCLAGFERRVMQCMAILGPIQPRLLQDIVDPIQSEDFDGVLERLSRHELILEYGESHALRVHSEQLRHDLIGETDFIERRHWCRRAVHLIGMSEAGHDDYYRLARYSLDSGEILKAIGHGMSALDELEEHWEFGDALELCERLQNLAGLTATQRFQLLERACHLALIVGDAKRSKRLANALRNEPGWEDNPLWRWRAEWVLGRICLFTGGYEEARLRLDSAHSWIPENANPAERIELASACVLARMLTGRPEQAEVLADSTLAALTSTMDIRVVRTAIYLWALRTNLAWIQGNTQASEAHTNKGFQLAESFKLHFPEEAPAIQADLCQLWLMRANACYYQGRYGDTIQSSGEALQYFETLGDLLFMGRCHYLMGLSQTMAGDYPAAIHHFDTLYDLAKRGDSKADICSACAQLGVLYRMAGKLRVAQDILEEGLAVARGLKDQRMTGILLGHLGEVWHRREQYDQAKTYYEEAVKVLQYTSKADLLENLRRMLELSFDEGVLQNFEMKVAEALTLARSLRRPQDEGNLLSLLGAYSARMGRFREAMSHYQGGEASLRTAGAHFDLGRLKLRQGHSYMDAGAIAEAENSLRAAEETFRRLEALPFARKAQETLRLLEETSQGSAQVHKKLQMLLEVTRSLNSVTDIAELLDLVVEKAIFLTQSERGFILLYNEKGEPSLHSARHIGLAEIQGDGAKLSNTVLKRICETRAAVTVTNVDRDSELRSQKSVVSLGLRSLLAAPLNRGDKLLGVLYLDSSKPVEEFYRRDQSLLQALADAAAIAVENAKLVTSLRRKNELMSFLAHEFRSPMTATMLFTRQMLRRAENLSEEDKEALGGIVHQSERLSRMIDNILTLAQLDAQQVQITKAPVSVAQVLELTAQGLAPIAKEAAVEVLIHLDESDLKTVGSTDRLVQVCTNLLANALKNVPAQSVIVLRARVIEKEARASTDAEPSTGPTPSEGFIAQRDEIVVEVFDEGLGIPEAELLLIFERFTQSGSPTQRAQGTGLGLNICREIVHEHHGRIWAENRKEGGAAFRFTLPLLLEAEEDMES